MKRFFNYMIAVSAILMAFSGCKKEEIPEGPGLNELIIGEWKGNVPEISGLEFYSSFKEDGTFDLYQKSGDASFELFTGTYTITGNTISGKYSDGEAWGSDYIVTITENKMEWIPAAEGEKMTNVFVRAEIPDFS